MRTLIHRFGDFFRKAKTVEFWEAGNAEIVGFIIVTPILAFFLVAVTGFVQLSMLRTKVDYATYAACRAAAISADEKTGLQSAKATFQMNLQGVVDYVDAENIEVEVKPIAHNTKITVKAKRKKYHDKTPKITSVTSTMKKHNGKGKWEQGEYISCATRCRSKTVSAIANILKPEITSMNVMLIESKSAPEYGKSGSSSSDKNGNPAGGPKRVVQ